MARTTWRELGPRKSAHIILTLSCEMVAFLAMDFIAFHLPKAQAIPLAWVSLAFAGLIFSVLRHISSIPLIIAGVLLSLVPVSLFGSIMVHWRLLGDFAVGEFAFMLLVALTGKYRKIPVRRQYDNWDTEADD